MTYGRGARCPIFFFLNDWRICQVTVRKYIHRQCNLLFFNMDCMSFVHAFIGSLSEDRHMSFMNACIQQALNETPERANNEYILLFDDMNFHPTYAFAFKQPGSVSWLKLTGCRRIITHRFAPAYDSFVFFYKICVYQWRKWFASRCR